MCTGYPRSVSSTGAFSVFWPCVWTASGPSLPARPP